MRYARKLNCAEINSCFYREHKPETYAKWAASVPENFRFAVKAPRSITHEGELRVEGEEALKCFLAADQRSRRKARPNAIADSAQAGIFKNQGERLLQHVSPAL